jgi:uncharacterized membrane protein
VRHRMAVAVLALVGALVSMYLLLYKLGIVGTLACGPGGGCERVQASRWSSLLGVPVAAYGVVGYAVLMGIALYGLRLEQLDRPHATRWLVRLSALGFLFSLYLLALELFVIHSVCRWCAVSGLIITAILAVAIVGLQRASRAPAR